MKLCITVEEHAELQKRVRAVLNTWNHRTRREGSLIDISVIILGILGDMEFAELLELYHHKAKRQHTSNCREDYYDSPVVGPSVQGHDSPLQSHMHLRGGEQGPERLARDVPGTDPWAKPS
jgi:hypothetical protein